MKDSDNSIVNSSAAKTPLETPILLLGYNRVNEIASVLNAIRKVRPIKLYVALDGPRIQYPEDRLKCKEVRETIKKIKWVRELKTLFREENSGLMRSVPEAISWFFEHEKEGIILEDDCVPTRSFFKFCSQMLEEFRCDERIMMVSGYNKQGTWELDSNDYFFSHLGGIWGWASWQRAWAHYDIEMKYLDRVIQNRLLRDLLGEKTGKIREQQFRDVRNLEVQTWDVQWGYSRHVQHGISIVPSKNLVANIGYGEQATNTKRRPHKQVPSYELDFPLKKNSVLIPDRSYDDLYFQGGTKNIMTKLKRIFRNVNQCLK